MGTTIMTDSGYEVSLEGGGKGFQSSISTSTLEGGVGLVHRRIEADGGGPPPVFLLSWSHPLVSVHGFWHSGARYDKGLGVDWGEGFYSKATSGAPVGCLYDLEGRNRLTFALSDALNPATFHAGVHEESGEVNCWVRLFDEPLGPLGVYEAALRLDTRDLPYHEALSDVSRWWAHLPGYEPAGVPQTARLPMYSTWYSFHQDLDPGRVEEQCRLAKELGCEAVIVDDGWQTASNERGYAHTGDWRPAEQKVPDMADHVRRVHGIGMKY